MTRTTARNINAAGALGLTLVVAGAYTFQFVLGEIPCPLCLFQRIAMLMTAFGLLLNVKFGVRPAHYGIAILAAIAGILIAGRQVLLHIVPVPSGSTGYGSPIAGLHLYTWALLIFAATILVIAFMLLQRRSFEEKHEYRLTTFQKGVFFAAILLALGNIGTTFVECGVKGCPDDPTGYWLFPR